jgi:spore coat protein U-like protein
MRIFILGLVLLGAISARGDADYTLQIGNAVWTGSPGGYDCFSGTAYPNTINFTITKQKPGNRPFAVAAGPSATTGSYSRQMASGGSRLNYQLYTTSSLNYVLKTPPSAIASEIITGRPDYPQQTVIPLSFTLYIPPGQLVAAGGYTDQITFSVYRTYDDTSAPQDTRTVSITAVVASGASLAVVPTGSGFSSSASQTLNFGTLTSGRSLGCDLLVRKNTGCNLTFSSSNGGVMRLLSELTSDQVSYSITVNGSPLSLASTANLTLPGGVSPSQDGNRLPVSITIGDVGSAAAGNYRDEITITVVAN